jgi:hypothetical protein
MPSPKSRDGCKLLEPILVPFLNHFIHTSGTSRWWSGQSNLFCISFLAEKLCTHAQKIAWCAIFSHTDTLKPIANANTWAVSIRHRSIPLYYSNVCMTWHTLQSMHANMHPNPLLMQTLGLQAFAIGVYLCITPLFARLLGTHCEACMPTRIETHR